MFFEQFGSAQRRQEIAFDLGEFVSHNRWPRHQHQRYWLPQIVLMQPECLPQQPPRAAARHRRTEFAAGNHAHARGGTGRQHRPIGNQTTGSQPLSLLLDPGEVARLLEAPGLRQAQPGPFGGHRQSDWRQALASLAAAVPQDRPTALAGIATQKAVLPAAANLRGLILTFHTVIRFTSAW